jgi:hypothetical protein
MILISTKEIISKSQVKILNLKSKNLKRKMAKRGQQREKQGT